MSIDLPRIAELRKGGAMKLHHITLASLCLSAAVSFVILETAVFRATGISSGTIALLTIWLLSCIAGLFAEIVRRAEP